MVWMPFDTESRSPVSDVARLFSEEAVKKLVALSRAELTFLPVDRMFWETLAWEEML